MSAAAFFNDNRAIAGFGNSMRAVFTSIRELVENGLDSAEKRGANPVVSIDLRKLSSREINTLEGDITEYYLETLYNEISPRGSGIYIYPEESDINNFTEIIELINDGNDQSILTASNKALNLGYEIIQFHQTGPNENTYFILKEKVPEGSKNKKGWGSYIINDNSENGIIIESPYPLNHIRSGLISIMAFKELKAKALLLPGAHRFSSFEKIYVETPVQIVTPPQTIPATPLATLSVKVKSSDILYFPH